MLKKILIGVVALVIVFGIGLFFWARSVLTGDNVRTAVAAQLSDALGQPVTVGGVTASVYPRVTMTLEAVRIGEPASIEIGSLHVGTDFGALLSRRIEHAALRIADAHITLPLPPLAVGGGAPAGDAPGSEPEAGGTPPVELVSIDEIVLTGVELTSGGRSLRGDIEIVPIGTTGLEIRRADLAADDTRIAITGTITDLSRPAGDLTLKANALDFDALMAFASEFGGGVAAPAAAAGTPAAPAGGPAATAAAVPGNLDITIAIETERASFGDLALDALSARARLTPDGLALDPVSFGVFGGRYEGALTLTLDETPAFDLDTTLTGIDMAAVMAFADAAGIMTGRMSGTLALTGEGMTADEVIRTARGTARIDVADGTVKGLGLVRGIVLATSMRQASQANLGSTAVDEPFTSLSGTLTVADGAGRTEDLRFESPDVTLTAAGVVQLDGSALDVRGQAVLSEELTAQAGTDFQRVAAQQGRITLPATITGSAENLQVRIDVADMAKRAITNRANEEAKKVIERNLPGGLPGGLRIPG